MEKKHEKKKFPSFWISPDIQLVETPLNADANKKAKHYRSNSGKLSPYQDSATLSKLQSALKIITRKQSPVNSMRIKNSKKKSACFKSQKTQIGNHMSKIKTQKGKIIKKGLKKKQKEEKLVILEKEICQKAPKIFKNQIFRDIYDRFGNHDRVMETFEVSQSIEKHEDCERIEAKFIIASNLETEQPEDEIVDYKQPENSFLAETEKDIKKNHFELFSKLNEFAKRQKEVEE